MAATMATPPPFGCSAAKKSSSLRVANREAIIGSLRQMSALPASGRGIAMGHLSENGPMQQLEEWDDFVATRYRQGKSEEEFRNYEADANPGVTQFYRQNHANQTFDFVLQKKAEYCGLTRGKKSVWEMAEYLNTLVDESDPDTDLTQIEHLLQTAEAIRKDGHPRWFILAGFVHDLGKVLCLYGEPQWAVVGDTFPVGCSYSNDIVFPEFFAANPDSKMPKYQSKYGVYEPNCGLGNVHLSFGHDEYIYHVTRRYLPEEAQYMLRYHSFYPAHKHGAYRHLMDDHDERMFEWVRKFNPYDLYSKGRERPNLQAILPFYQDLIAEFFPDQIDW
jgi:inositol oxygenase